jgi:hypothetical protein
MSGVYARRDLARRIGGVLMFKTLCVDDIPRTAARTKTPEAAEWKEWKGLVLCKEAKLASAGVWEDINRPLKVKLIFRFANLPYATRDTESQIDIEYVQTTVREIRKHAAIHTLGTSGAVVYFKIPDATLNMAATFDVEIYEMTETERNAAYSDPLFL